MLYLALHKGFYICWEQICISYPIEWDLNKSKFSIDATCSPVTGFIFLKAALSAKWIIASSEDCGRQTQREYTLLMIIFYLIKPYWSISLLIRKQFINVSCHRVWICQDKRHGLTSWSQRNIWTTRSFGLWDGVEATCGQKRTSDCWNISMV